MHQTNSPQLGAAGDGRQGHAAGEAARRILQGLLEAMLGNEEGAPSACDPEFLHDFRVAVQRTRSALSQVKGVLPGAFFNGENHGKLLASVTNGGGFQEEQAPV